MQTKNIGKYIVYSDGRVWSKWGKEFIKQRINNNGYVDVFLDRGKKSLHRIIAEIFIPNPDKLPQVDHINNNKLDNRAENLRWCTASQNTKWAYENNLINNHRGEESVKSKLKESEVAEIYTNPNKLKQRELAKQFNISQYAIWCIQNHESWTHITKDLIPGHRNKRGTN